MSDFTRNMVADAIAQADAAAADCDAWQAQHNARMEVKRKDFCDELIYKIRDDALVSPQPIARTPTPVE